MLYNCKRVVLFVYLGLSLRIKKKWKLTKNKVFLSSFKITQLVFIFSNDLLNFYGG